MSANSLLKHYIRKTVELLSHSERYEWGNMGACNCGHLAQVMTGHTRQYIHSAGLETDGDWSEKSELYCDTSGKKINNVISIMLSKGLQIHDINHIEYLDHPEILKNLPSNHSYLRHNHKPHVIAYFESWAKLLDKMDQNKEKWNARKSMPVTEVDTYDSIPQYA